MALWRWVVVGGVAVAAVAVATVAFVVWDWPWVVAVDLAADQRPVGFSVVTSISTAVGAVGASVGAVGTFAVALVALRQLGEQRRTSTFTSWRDALWRFSREWDDLSGERRLLQDSIVAGTFHGANPQDRQNATDVLNFFDGLAFMANRKHLDDEMSWFWFYEEALYVWNELQPHITYVRSEDPLAWSEYPIWLDRITEMERRNQARARAEAWPTTGQG